MRRAILIPGAAACAAGVRRRQGAPASLPGVVPGKYDRPTGCLLNPRCPYANERCRNEEPELRSIPGRQVKCHTPLDDAGGRPYEPESTFTAGDRPEEALPGEKGLFAPERLVKALDGVSFTTSAAKRWRWSASRAAANRRSAVC